MGRKNGARFPWPPMLERLVNPVTLLNEENDLGLMFRRPLHLIFEPLLFGQFVIPPVILFLQGIQVFEVWTFVSTMAQAS